MGNKNGAVGSIEKKSNSIFTWSLQDIKKLVDAGDQCWRDSPSFFYKYHWCLQVHPHLDGNPYVAFRLRLTTEEEKINIKYRLSISVPNQGIVWQSCTIFDSFGEKEDLGMIVTHKKSFIENVISCSSDSISLDVQFKPYGKSVPFTLLRASLPSLSSADEHLLNREIVKKTTKDVFPEKGEKKASIVELSMLSSALGNLFRSGDGSDVIVKAGEKTFPAHKAVLMARSPVFRRMLQLDMTEKKNGVIQIRDSNPSSVEKLLSYLYTGDLPDMKEEEVVGLFTLADMYNLPSLVEHCRDYILDMLNTDNFFELFTVGTGYVDQKIVDHCKDFFKANIKSIVKTENWRMFLIKNPSVASDLIAESI